MNIKEMRDLTGQTQKEFANMYGIPVGTLRRWEYGESTPAPYIVEMIAERLPFTDERLKKIKTYNGTFFYDEDAKQIIDIRGTRISIEEDLNGVKEQNLAIYAKNLFDAYYEAVNRFNKDCKLDKQENIMWG